MTATADRAPLAPLAPRVPGWPVVGPVGDVLRDPLGLYERASRECGDVARLVVGVPPLRRTLHLVLHPDGARHVLAGRGREYGKDTPVYEEVRAYLGDGLLTSQGARWERQKRLLQPLFTPRRVASSAAVMAEEAELLAATWRQRARAGAPVDLHAGAMTCTLRVVGRLLLGTALDDALEVVGRSMDPLQRHVMARGTAPARLPRHWPTPGGRRAARHRAALHALVDGVVDAAASAAGPRDDPREGDDLLSLLMGARDPLDGSPLSREEVRDQVLVFVLAGHETTALALTFALHLLGRHPAVQERARAEAAASTGVGEGLPFVRRVLEEALRLYPPAPVVGRAALRDDVVLGHRVRAGEVVVVPVWALHRDPRWWPEPRRFDPDRFAPDAAEGRHRYAYLPFGGGPRACIGAQFALLEGTVALAAVLRAVEVSAAPDLPRLFTGLTLRPRGPVLARLEPLGG